METQFRRLTDMTPEELRQHAHALVGRMATLAAVDEPTEAQEEEFYRLRDRHEAAGVLLAGFEARAAQRDAVLSSGGYGVERGAFVEAPASAGGTSRSRLEDGPMRSLEVLERSGRLTARQAEGLAGVLGRGDARERAAAAGYVEAAGSPAYLSAVLHVLRDPVRGHTMWTPEEQDAWRRAQTWQAERAAAEGTDSAGGVLVPLPLDPAVILTDGTRTGVPSPLRSVCRTVTTAGSKYRAVTSSGAAAHWRAELAEVPAEDPQLAEVDVPVHSLATYTECSYELLQDAPDALGQLQRILADARLQKENEGFVTGSGTGEPRGLVTALLAAGGDGVTLGGAALAATDLRAVVEAVPRRWVGASRWFAPSPVLDSVALFEDLAGGRIAESLSSSGVMLRRPVTEVPDLAGTGTGGAHVLALGDPSAYVIADRLGATFEVSPSSVVGTNRRPILARGILLHSRTGADLIVPSAFRYALVPA